MKRSKKSQRFAIWTAAAVVVAIAVASLMIQRAPRVYPHLVIHVSDSLRVNFLHQAQRDEGRCTALVDRVLRSVLSQCPQCQVLEKGCVERLTPRQRSMLTSGSLDIPMVRLPGGGAITFEGAVTASALQNCVETGRQAVEKLHHQATCSAPTDNLFGLPVAALDGATATLVPQERAFAGAAGLAAVLSFITCFLIVYSQRLHGKYTHDQVRSGPQKFHISPTPRIGGLGIAVGLVGAVLLLGNFDWIKPGAVYGISLLALAGTPAFAGGLAEDVTKRVGVLSRLLLTFSAALLASEWLGATVERTGIPLLDYWLTFPLVAMFFTVFAVGGIANAINIIDGYNGLSSGYALIVLIVLAAVGWKLGDQLVMLGAIAMGGALLGFVVWNYPKGRIFMGDGGAYLLGFWLAELSILIVVRNPGVSAWFPILLLIYPIMEICVSVYRKKLLRGRSPGQPDRLHLHMLIHQRLARVSVGSKQPEHITRRNSMVAKYVWLATGVFVFPAIALWNNTLILITLTLLFGIMYLWLYIRLLQWRAPGWLVVEHKPIR
jgi:UDP-GlcNAc:undecaprenyl-phosphate/decaprenyl-phosphate GlcNAc-1-phosphate transferase